MGVMRDSKTGVPTRAKTVRMQWVALCSSEGIVRPYAFEPFNVP